VIYNPLFNTDLFRHSGIFVTRWQFLLYTEQHRETH